MKKKLKPKNSVQLNTELNYPVFVFDKNWDFSIKTILNNSFYEKIINDDLEFCKSKLLDENKEINKIINFFYKDWFKNCQDRKFFLFLYIYILEQIANKADNMFLVKKIKIFFNLSYLRDSSTFI